MMNRGTKLSKACDPCRRRKVKCDGQEPCRNCQHWPSACSYRLKARIRRRVLPRTQSPSRAPSIEERSGIEHQEREHLGSEDPGTERPGIEGSGLTALADQDSPAAVYDGVAATTHIDSSQLFYGPTSNFAFVQQLRRLTVSLADADQPHHHHYHRHRSPQHSRLDLDVFQQRHVFFGTPLRADPAAAAIMYAQGSITRLIPKHLAASFLENFKIATLNILPFPPAPELDGLLDALYRHDREPGLGLSPQKKALVLIVLANGGLCTTQTELAETIFLQAKEQARPFEESVTLEMIQFSLLSADYQLNMGRPTSAYLQIGAACRKAFAMGFPLVQASSPHRAADDQQHRITLWALYFHDVWYSILAGRRSVIRRADMLCPYPDDQPVLGSLCQIAAILEDIVDSIYGRKSHSLRALYTIAEDIHARLRKCSEKFGLGSADAAQKGTPSEAMGMLTLHNAYFHAVQTAFRPFLIAESALANTHETGEIWLRQACRNATDAAVDSIVFTSSMFQSIDLQKLRRRDHFFLEASCAVLLYDSVQHPFKHANNMNYVQIAMRSLESMPKDEPVTNAVSSIQRIIDAVERCIRRQKDLQTSASVVASSSVDPCPNPRPTPTHQGLDYTAGGINSPSPSHYLPDGFRPAADGQPYQTLSQLDFNVLTTDLEEYFPMFTTGDLSIGNVQDLTT